MDPTRRLSEDEAHGILARAAEIDARSPQMVSEAELWRAAEAAGISRDAFAQATAELRAGTLERARGRHALSIALVRPAKVFIALGLFYAAFRTPDYSGWWIAQSVGAAWAIYGAYKTVGAIMRWTQSLRGSRASTHETVQSQTREDSSRSDTLMAVRVLSLRQVPRGAA